MVMNYVWLVVLMCSVQGCEVGFSGPNCSKPCQYPSFGQQCQEECNCTQDICNIITGCAECPIGFFGKLCIQACRYPGFGAQCQKTCNCSEGNCNHITGCMIIQGCEEGYFGQGCISPCRYPSYGRKCQYECTCALNECNHIKGCGNWRGNQMNTTNMGGVIKSSDQTWLKKKQFISIIAGSSVLLVFTLVAITMVARYCIRHKTRNTEPEFDSEFSSFQSNEYVADITDNITSVRYCQHDAFRENYQDEIYANSCR
ncbi:protein draper-like isoform X2 [Crassostrea angulata]|uniref:protein draper-like isoform X2 n=1 Tax=Magallana angulata TaxID=2784310 RepID=UPI0022B10CBA|nr:protein draper-like isoform X2 [Crassostrea angulata]